MDVSYNFLKVERSTKFCFLALRKQVFGLEIIGLYPMASWLL